MTMPATSDAVPDRKTKRSGERTTAGQEQALARARHSVAAQQRRDRHPEPGEPAQQRDPAHEPRHVRHLALEERTVTPGEGEEALARDDDAVGPGHPSEQRQRGRIGPREDGGGRYPLHRSKSAGPRDRPARAGRPIPPSARSCTPYQRPRLKKPRSSRTSTTIRMIQRMTHAGHPLSEVAHVIPRPRRSETAR